MSGLLRRLTRRRAATADEPRPSAPETSEPDAAPADTPAEPGGQPPVDPGEQPTELIPATGEQPAAAGEAGTAVEPGEAAAGQQPAAAGEAQTAGEAAEAATGLQPAPATGGGEQAAPSEAGARVAGDLPAGIDPGELEVAPAPSARRGKLRRRLRYLRRVRELLLRDLGGFAYEVHRTAGGSPRESHRRLAEAKASRLAALDAEVRDLEGRLSEPHAQPVLREPGIGGTCPECGELHASDAHYCSRCGAPLDAKARSAREAAIRAAAQPTTGAQPTPEPKPASVLWAAGPRPQAQTPRPEPAAEAAQPKTSMATSEWLAVPGKPAATAPAGAEPTTTEPEPAPAAGDAAPGGASGDRDELTVVGGEAEGAPAPGGASGEPDDPKVAAGETKTEAEPAPTPGDAAPGEASGEPDEPAATGDEARRRAPEGAPVADEAPADAAPGESSAEVAAEEKPKAARRPRARKPPKETAPEEAGPNGRRDEDVPPPVSSGDPLGSPAERRP